MADSGSSGPPASTSASPSTSSSSSATTALLAGGAGEGGGGGVARAAAVLLSLGPDVAAELLKRLPPAAVERLVRSAPALKQAPSGFVEEAAVDFVDAMERYGNASHTRDLALVEIMERAIGPDGVRRALEPKAPTGDKRLQAILAAEVGDLALLLEREQIPTAAIALSLLPTEKAAVVLAKLPEALRAQMLRALLAIDAVSPELVDDIVDGLSGEVQTFAKHGKRSKLDGEQAAVGILRRMSAEDQKNTVAEIEKGDAQLAESLRGKLIAFEDIAELPRKEIQLFLQSCDARTLALALKGAPESVVDKILSNMSQRAAASFREEMDMLGRVRVSQVEGAQADLVKLVLKLAEEGKVTLVAATEKMV